MEFLLFIFDGIMKLFFFFTLFDGKFNWNRHDTKTGDDTANYLLATIFFFIFFGPSPDAILLWNIIELLLFGKEEEDKSYSVYIQINCGSEVASSSSALFWEVLPRELVIVVVRVSIDPSMNGRRGLSWIAS